MRGNGNRPAHFASWAEVAFTCRCCDLWKPGGHPGGQEQSDLSATRASAPR